MLSPISIRLIVSELLPTPSGGEGIFLVSEIL
jgi:hypothetical protein